MIPMSPLICVSLIVTHHFALVPGWNIQMFMSHPFSRNSPDSHYSYAGHCYLGLFLPQVLIFSRTIQDVYLYTSTFLKGAKQTSKQNNFTSFGNVQLLRIYLLRHYFTHVPKSNLSKKSNVRECSVIRNNSSLIHAYTCWYIEIKKLTQILCEIIRIFILKK